MFKFFIIFFIVITTPLLGRTWVFGDSGKIPKEGVDVGYEKDGTALKMCLGPYKKGIYIGKIRRGFKGCNIGVDGTETAIRQYAVLTKKLSWEKIIDGKIPKNSKKFGYDQDKKPLYGCRGKFKGGLHIGYTGEKLGNCIIGWGGKMHKVEIFEIPSLKDDKKVDKGKKVEKTYSEPEKMRGITEEHNKVRRALGIKELKWSPKIAKYSQQWANYLAKNNGCKMKHRPRSGKYKQIYGENLYWSSAIRWSSGKRELAKRTPKDAVKGWADEVKDYNYKTNSCDAGKVCGHYTQVVWANSKNVGCAMAICDDKTQVWVCNYDPPGNYRGQKPY